jgi:hypothetical protein
MQKITPNLWFDYTILNNPGAFQKMMGVRKIIIVEFNDK